MDEVSSDVAMAQIPERDEPEPSISALPDEPSDWPELATREDEARVRSNDGKEIWSKGMWSEEEVYLDQLENKLRRVKNDREGVVAKEEEIDDDSNTRVKLVRQGSIGSSLSSNSEDLERKEEPIVETNQESTSDEHPEQTLETDPTTPLLADQADRSDSPLPPRSQSRSNPSSPPPPQPRSVLGTPLSTSPTPISLPLPKPPTHLGVTDGTKPKDDKTIKPRLLSSDSKIRFSPRVRVKSGMSGLRGVSGLGPHSGAAATGTGMGTEESSPTPSRRSSRISSSRLPSFSMSTTHPAPPSSQPQSRSQSRTQTPTSTPGYEPSSLPSSSSISLCASPPVQYSWLFGGPSLGRMAERLSFGNSSASASGSGSGSGVGAGGAQGQREGDYFSLNFGNLSSGSGQGQGESTGGEGERGREGRRSKIWDVFPSPAGFYSPSVLPSPGPGPGLRSGQGLIPARSPALGTGDLNSNSRSGSGMGVGTGAGTGAGAIQRDPEIERLSATAARKRAEVWAREHSIGRSASASASARGSGGRAASASGVEAGPETGLKGSMGKRTGDGYGTMTHPSELTLGRGVRNVSGGSILLNASPVSPDFSKEEGNEDEPNGWGPWISGVLGGTWKGCEGFWCGADEEEEEEEEAQERRARRRRQGRSR